MPISSDFPHETIDNDEDAASYQRATLGFAVSEINIKTEQQSGHFLLDMLRHGEINLDTPFQRSADLWKPDVMSRFIESMMLKFPIPAFYFNVAFKNNDPGAPFWEVIDGLQRLSALRRFFFGDLFGKKLALRDLDFFPELNGCTVDSIPRHLRRNIEACQMTMFEVFPNTPKIVKYRIFERVNTGGLKLNEQEIRHALNQGRPVETLSRAVQICLIQNSIIVDPGRMRDHELALRHIAFQIIPISQFRGNLKEFLDRGMEELANLSDRQSDDLLSEFAGSVEFIKLLLGPLAFRKDLNRGLNKALFDSYTYAASQTTDAEKRIALANRDFAITLYLASFNDPEYLSSITYATARQENISKRFTFAKELLSRVVHDQPT